jgi:predicted dehydrogenase
VNRLRVAVVGCGHLGSIHARLLQSLDDVQLVGVVDPLLAARERVAAECAVPAFAHSDELHNHVDAAIIATPTAHHHEVAERLLSDGVHVLVEKPVTKTVAEANRLIALARRRGLVLQVGHVERFNPAWNAVVRHLTRPQYIEAVRAGSYTFRSTDVSIVLDLMIHDLDLVLSLTDSPIVDVELKFANGCIATLKASRVNYEPQRSMHVFSQHVFAAIDFAKGEARLIHPAPAVLRGEVDLTCCPPEQRQQVQESMFRELLSLETLQVERANAILQEQREFVASVLHGDPVRVPGEQGRDALAVAEQILNSIRTHRWNSHLPSAIGPHALFEPALGQSKRAA